MPRPSPAPSRREVAGGMGQVGGGAVVAEKTSQSVAASDAPRAAAIVAAPAAVDQRYGAPKLLADARSSAGCYAVITDSAMALPRRLWLDSSLVNAAATSQSSRAAVDALAMERRGVSEIANDVRRSIPEAYWVPRRDGSIRLSLPGIPMGVDLLPASASTFAGTAAVGDRSITVALRRVECGGR
jgi:hypothetical protein